MQTIKIGKGIEIIREVRYDCLYCSTPGKKNKNYLIDDNGNKKTFCKDCLKMLYKVKL